MAESKIITDIYAPIVQTPKPEESISVVDPMATPQDKSLGDQVKEVLDELYPDWSWGIEIPRPFFGMKRDDIIIRNYDCDPRGNMGFYLRKSALSGGSLRITIMRAAGEFLERYKMRRAGFREEETADRIMTFEKADT